MPESQAFGPAAVKLLARVGNLVLAWNAVEYWMRIFVSSYTGNTWQTFIATTERRGGPLKDRMADAATRLSNADVRDAVMHFTEAYDRLREQRNRVIHRLKTVIELRDQPPKALLFDVNRTGVSTEFLTDGEIAALVTVCWTFEEYARQVSVAADYDGSIRAGASLPEKPELPARYTETRLGVR